MTFIIAGVESKECRLLLDDVDLKVRVEHKVLLERKALMETLGQMVLWAQMVGADNKEHRETCVGHKVAMQ
jgi:hypothetical protein